MKFACDDKFPISITINDIRLKSFQFCYLLVLRIRQVRELFC